MRAGCNQMFVLLIVMVTSAHTGDNCIYQGCKCDDTAVNCDGMNLTAIPPMSLTGEKKVIYLQFDDNNITTIPSGSLPAGLSQVTFTNNPIQNIDDNAFTNLATSLQTLGLTLVPHSRIPDALLQLKNLTSLEIYNTSVGDWNENVMKYLAPQLYTLSLNYVNLDTWPDWIQYCRQVSGMGLVDSFLTSIPDDALDGISSSVISLTLSGNNLTAIPKAISKFTNMIILDVHQNKIRDVAWLPKQCRMDTLDLSKNKIFNATQLSLAVRPYAEFLNELDIDHNELTAIPDLDFLKINDFDFSFNNIYDLQAGSLPSTVYWLYLGNNLLSSIPRAVSSLQLLSTLLMSSNLVTNIQASTIPLNLQYLDLEHNQVTELTEFSFPENSSLVSLTLDNNPLTKISDNAFVNLAKLQELHLSGTRLSRLPLGLSSLHSITTLNLIGITGLVCTCQEKDLGPWIKSMTSENVLGNCGLTKVYDFFDVLSPDCPA